MRVVFQKPFEPVANPLELGSHKGPGATQFGGDFSLLEALELQVENLHVGLVETVQGFFDQIRGRDNFIWSWLSAANRVAVGVFLAFGRPSIGVDLLRVFEKFMQSDNFQEPPQIG